MGKLTYHETWPSERPVRAVRTSVGYVLADAADHIAIDEHGEAYTYATKDAAEHAIRNYREE